MHSSPNFVHVEQLFCYHFCVFAEFLIFVIRLVGTLAVMFDFVESCWLCLVQLLKISDVSENQDDFVEFHRTDLERVEIALQDGTACSNQYFRLSTGWRSISSKQYLLIRF